MSVSGVIESPAAGQAALLIIDMINELDFPEAEGMVGAMKAVADRITTLRHAARDASVPVVFVNDNFGQWHSERSKLIEHCRAKSEISAAIIDALEADGGDYFVIKPMSSGFYATNLPVLLPKLGASRVILTGVATDICVLFTAADAHMRAYEIWTPSDCVAAHTRERSDWALEIMRKSMGAETASTSELSLVDWISRPDRSRGA